MLIEKNIIRKALQEDNSKNDLTSEAIIPRKETVRAVIVTRQPCVVCGLNLAKEIFKTQDTKIQFTPLTKDGARVAKGKILAKITGKAKSILTAERTALNFLIILSGIATKTRKFCEAVKPYNAKILDTRKTIPLLRKLQKYAVKIGGGHNHRMSLSDMVLIKDNHIKVTRSQRPTLKDASAPAAAGGHKVTRIIEEARRKVGKKYKIEVEVNNLKQFKEAIKGAPDIIMLDNMRLSQIKKAVKILRATPYALRRTLLEASGGITLKNIRKIASSGIDFISIGELTHTIKSIDISLEIL